MVKAVARAYVTKALFSLQLFWFSNVSSISLELAGWFGPLPCVGGRVEGGGVVVLLGWLGCARLHVRSLCTMARWRCHLVVASLALHVLLRASTLHFWNGMARMQRFGLDSFYASKKSSLHVDFV